MTEERLEESDDESSDVSSTGTQRPAELTDMNRPSVYDILMKQHRDAILRIHVLEAENQKMMDILKQTVSENQAANPGELMARTRTGDATSGESSLAYNVNDLGRNNRTITQLRAQNQTLAAQVSKLRGQLQKSARVSKPRRRRRSSRNDRSGLFSRLLRTIINLAPGN